MTCYRVGIRMDEPRMASLLISHRRPGFYFRVLEEGEVGAGDEIAKVADGSERISVAEVDALLYLPGHPRDSLERAMRVPALSPGWKSSLSALLTQEGPGNAGLISATAPPPAWARVSFSLRGAHRSRVRKRTLVFARVPRISLLYPLRSPASP